MLRTALVAALDPWPPLCNSFPRAQLTMGLAQARRVPV